MSSAPAQPYAIDFEVVACGKVVPNSKRRIRWRYGFADSAALAAGKTGAACRGVEHDVTLVWSAYSGKSVLMGDGEELHFNANTAEGTEHSWSKGGRLLRMTAQASSLVSNSWLDPGRRRYNFFVDGKSFFDFPKLNQLGTTGKQKTTVKSLGPKSPAEEDAQLRQAVQASIAYESNPTPQSAPQRRLSVQASQLLIDFFDDFDTTGNTLPPPAPSPAGDADPWAFTDTPAPTAAVPATPTNPFETASPTPPAPAAGFDFFAAPAPAGGPPAPPPAAAPPQAPANFDPFSAFDGGAPPPATQGAMVMGENQGGNWGLQAGQQQPPPYTMAGGYGQQQQGQGSSQQNQWGAPPS